MSRKLKERCPNCIVVGVDPHGSILAVPNSLNTRLEPYKVNPFCLLSVELSFVELINPRCDF